MERFLKEWNNGAATVVVHTSGSTGVPKEMRVEKQRMEVSARITCDFLGLRMGDIALLCMSTDYIAGKMMVVRALVRGLRLIAVVPDGHPMKTLTDPVDFVAMVPMQVWNTLQVPRERQLLMQSRHLLIGGGAVDASLAEELKTFPGAVWSSYGMTETLSHIALRRMNGKETSQWYAPLDGVSVRLSGDGCLVIDAPAIHEGELLTNDLAVLREDGCFRILGRRDNVICSGGIKIQAEEVERLLHPFYRVPFIITKQKDAKFGEAVVLLTEGTLQEAREVCERVLPKYWCPRRYLHVAHVPLTATGKPARAVAEQIAARAP